MASTGAGDADFLWFLPVLRGGPVTPGVRVPAINLDNNNALQIVL